jgi:hypothetical protein
MRIQSKDKSLKKTLLVLIHHPLFDSAEYWKQIFLRKVQHNLVAIEDFQTRIYVLIISVQHSMHFDGRPIIANVTVEARFLRSATESTVPNLWPV